ncbi:GvpL/GvpF family gas vesicle protein [Solirubrobacter ginsenosidimutans]|uniref:GvpL/GvpF family gas vesicle protein n=1 Tax=Solirubrobacter ginsenosidimutans TaxID=490573 RepID=A0A9X3MUF2_9ACTN|nr:GvpL/GvpF family gas vesicle protein [Solirubrobacter ginsenosidimutans]MDA0159938.1 GvpL/GvpF family gas vesicle protein [Solirubrobacter ginsenosidimutans]
MDVRSAAVVDRFALWVYGVLDSDAPGPARGQGVDGQPVEIVRADGFAALVSRVPCPRFDTHVLCRSLQERRTFEALVRAHQDVLREALALGAVVPFGFATVLENEAALRALLKRDRARLTEGLARLRGMSEWSLKAYSDEHRGGPLVDALHERLASTTTGAARLPSAERCVALHAAYLVTEAEATVFAGLVWRLAREHDADGISLELTGPWPAFHFSQAPATACLTGER